MHRFLVPLVALLLAACASTPPYRASVTPTGVGYSETQIESDRYFVTYRAGGSADAALLNDYALLRAADVTLAHNRDWFWVDRRSTDTSAAGRSGPSFGVSVGGVSGGRHSALGGSIGMSFPIGHPHETASAATLEIRLGQGPKPDDPNAYDAHSISANLRSRLMLRE